MSERQICLLGGVAVLFFLGLWIAIIPSAPSHEWYDWLRRAVGIGVVGFFAIRLFYFAYKAKD